MTTTDRVLHLLIAFGPASVRDLATVCDLSPRQIRHVVASLRARELVGPLGDGTWAAVGTGPLPQRRRGGPKAQPHHLVRWVPALLAEQPRTVRDLVEITGRSERMIRAALARTAVVVRPARRVAPRRSMVPALYGLRVSS